MGFHSAMLPPSARARGWLCRFVLLLAGQRRGRGAGPKQPGPCLGALRDRLRMLRVNGQPVLFLAGLCCFVGALFLPLSFLPSSVFFLAGLGALGIGLQLVATAAEPNTD
jgi:hypothetical protein